MTAETLSEKQIRTIRQSVAGERRSIQIGRSYNSACAGSGTPIKIIDGDASPELIGRPYLKTHFRNHGFRKTLYTYSTLEIAVGSGWIQHQINQ